MAYKYLAYTVEGTVVKGKLDVPTEGMAEEALERAGYRVLTLKQARPRLRMHQLLPSLFRVKPQYVIAFSRQLAMMIETGTPLLTALRLQRDRTTNEAFKAVIAEVISDLQEGNSFSEAIGKHPQAFGQLYGMIIKVGEQTGNLEAALRQVADYIEKEMAAKRKMQQAMTYPALVMLMAVGVIILLMTVALPPLLKVFAGYNAELPLPTKLLVGITGFVTSYKLYLLAAIVAIAALTVWYMRRPRGRRMRDKLLLKLPIIGPINMSRNMSQFSRTMSMLLPAGLPLTEVMAVVLQTTSNKIICEALSDVHKGLLQGQGLAQPMSRNKLFPPLLVQMVMVGEETDTLASNFAALANSYETEAAEKTERLISMMGPLLTVAIALVVAFIAISVILPMYSVLQVVE